MKMFIKFKSRIGNNAILKSSYLSISCLAIVIMYLCISCDTGQAKQDNSVVVSEEPVKDAGNADAKSKSTSNEELIREAATVGVELGKNIIKNIKVNDSIRAANREQMFAYQIGLPIKGKDEVFEAYQKMDNTEAIYVLEKSRKEFYLVKYEGKTKDELLNELEEFKKMIPSDISGTAKVINLMNLCSKKEKLMVGEAMTKRKESLELPCLICK